ncbi:CDP-alcohol phosphatidyltransferase family protein [Luteibacter yeojuensis]|uniref:CDP-alcohol phosphatidyltransferase family protein n=1 Tax=Luteibacter yeojuensis TaxID=345309 RepID=A0A7X5TPU7_9GAMM|nr:CDP-alcohol phosphatidyltransferase family protein [Luteibacter yeojuensis]NID15455.1 CDP-alcohol phosphatidyltransferase family protein [Luteibacter yeojuensis]
MHRRPIRSRDTRAVRGIARILALRSITPNQISALSVVFALIGTVLFGASPHSPAALVGVIVAIQLRLLCNLLDGMIAIEGDKAESSGRFFNEVPDRLADVLLLVPLGYAVDQDYLGWLIACLALSTAYLRAFGASLGFGEDFRGPGAKPHRMAMLTATCAAAALESIWRAPFWSFWLGAVALILLTSLTLVRRSQHIVRSLREKPRRSSFQVTSAFIREKE